MKLTLLGTGCPVVSTERYGPSQIVVHQGRAVLIDCGSGVTQRLAAAGYSGADLDAVFLTHLHSDHIVDLFQLVISSWHQGRDRPQKIYGPRGTEAYVTGLMKLWQPELEQRIAHERRSSTLALDLEVTEFEDGSVFTFGDLKVTAVEVEHQPVKHAFGFVLAAGARRLVVSGDTRRCEALVSAARGADLLLHEVFVHHALLPEAGTRTAETVERVASYHTLSDQVGKIATEAGVACLMLTHFVPPHCDRKALLAEVSRDFAGPVILGEDLMALDLSSGSLTYGQANLRLPTLPVQ